MNNEDCFGKVKPSHVNPLGLPPMSSVQLLSHAMTLQEERAATYEQPEGERSAGRVAAMFNAAKGSEVLFESDVLLILVMLKIVRGEATKKPHRDSAEDLVSYSALYAEARLDGR